MLILVFSQSYSQCSNPLYQFKEGTLIEMESYDAKGKVEGKTEPRVIKWNETASGFETTIGYKLYDKKKNWLTRGNIPWNVLMVSFTWI